MRGLLFLLTLLPALAIAQPATPLTVLSWVNPTTNVDGSPLTDLASVTIECGADRVVVPTTEVGAAVAEVLPAATKANIGVVECSGWAINTSGKSGTRSNVISFYCDGGNCYPLGIPAAPVLSVQ